MTAPRAITVPVRIPIKDLAQAIGVELGLQPVAPPKRGNAVVRHGLPTLEQAIEAVVQATSRLERDQYTSAEGASAGKLLEACKKLRRVALETNTPE